LAGDDKLVRRTIIPQQQKIAVVVMSRDRNPHFFVQTEIPPQFTIDEESFTEVSCPEHIGFYDWLLSNGDLEPIRVELMVDEPRSLDIARLTALVGVKTEGPNRLVVRFSDREDIDYQRSALQLFMGNRLFYGDQGSAALTFFAP
jgi:hypothetical protein